MADDELARQGLRELNPEEIETLKVKKKTYEEVRHILGKTISTYEHEIEGLKKKIADSKPSLSDVLQVPDGVSLIEHKEAHPYYGCGLRTVVYIGTTPRGGLSGGDDVYYCLYCKKVI
jgi:hypothetical protein